MIFGSKLLNPGLVRLGATLVWVEGHTLGTTAIQDVCKAYLFKYQFLKRNYRQKQNSFIFLC